MSAAPAMVEVHDLTIEYETPSGRVRAVDDVNFTIAPSEILGLVGESGSGKSSVAMALLGHVAPAATTVEGRVMLGGQNFLKMTPRVLAFCRGRRIGFVPQNPAMGLSPHLRIGRQFVEFALRHGAASDREEAMDLARAHFALVGLPESQHVARRYPHEPSGGQQQRVCIAMAVACRPEFLVLDEPTTGLDVTTQLRIVELLKELRSRFGMLYVTHDLGLLAQIADRVGVMYAGKLVETAPAERMFATPRHPYTRALIASVPSLEDSKLPGAKRLRGLLLRDALPAGCAFFPRCDHGQSACATSRQALEAIAPGHEWPANVGNPSKRKVLPSRQSAACLSRTLSAGRGWLSWRVSASLMVGPAYGNVCAAREPAWLSKACRCRLPKARSWRLSASLEAANPLSPGR